MTVDRKIINDLDFQGVQKVKNAVDPTAAQDYATKQYVDDSIGGGGAVSSVFTRTGAVVAAAGDYTASEVGFVPAGTISATDVQAAIEEVAAEATGGGGSPWAIETPAGTIDGSNDTFTLSAAPDPAGDLLLWKNGLLMKAGGVDYTLTGTTVVFVAGQIPPSGSVLLAALPGTSGGGLVTSVAKSGDTALTGDVTFSEGANITLTETGNDIEIASIGGGGAVGATELIYRYTVTGSDKDGIDTGADTPDAGTNDWTNGDLLEIYLYLRTDEAVVFSGFNMNVNNDTGSVYDRVFVQGLNATASANNARAAATWAINAAGASAGTNQFAQWCITCANFTGAVGNKILSAFGAVPDGTAAANMLQVSYSLGYRPATPAAITSLAIDVATSGKKFKVGSQLLIYKRTAS